MPKAILHRIQFKAKPKVLYDLIMNPKKHSAFTGAEAIISQQLGGKYSAYDGYIEGENLELIPGKKIVQTWRAMEEDWPEGENSLIEFVFEENEKGTELKFSHRQIPKNVKSDFDKGWKEHYWEPMKAYLNE